MDEKNAQIFKDTFTNFLYDKWSKGSIDLNDSESIIDCLYNEFVIVLKKQNWTFQTIDEFILIEEDSLNYEHDLNHIFAVKRGTVDDDKLLLERLKSCVRWLVVKGTFFPEIICYLNKFHSL